jgi:hypothetical protein
MVDFRPGVWGDAGHDPEDENDAEDEKEFFVCC